MDIRVRCIQKILVLAGLFSLLTAKANEFRYSHVLPYVKTVTFSEQSIVIETSNRSPIPQLLEEQSYLLERGSRFAQPITSAKIGMLTDRSISKATIRVSGGLPATSEGVPYKVLKAICTAHRRDSTTTISFDSEELEIEMDSCSSISTMESTDESLWVGTSYYDDHGSGGAEGMLIIDRETGKLVSKIDTGPLELYGSARDPFSSDMWIFVDDQIIVVSQNTRHRINMQFYHDFDSSTGEPEMRLAAGFNHSNPLAVLAKRLPQEIRADFFSSMQRHLPERLVSKFRLYDFFMCCGLSLDPLPSEYNFLGPFLVSAATHAIETSPHAGSPWQYSAAAVWRQLACRIDHPDANTLCADKRFNN